MLLLVTHFELPFILRIPSLNASQIQDYYVSATGDQSHRRRMVIG